MAKTKIVRYNGCRDNDDWPCAAPTELQAGIVYEVISINNYDFQTQYWLNGITGWFNSYWFDDVSLEEDRNYMIYTSDIPVVGQCLRCSKLEIIDGKSSHFSRWFTRPVQKVEYMGNHIYNVTTNSSTYKVLVR